MGSGFAAAAWAAVFEVEVSGGESASSSVEFGAVDFDEADDGVDGEGVFVAADVGAVL